MKKIIIPASMLFLAGLSDAQTTTPSITENYVYTKTYLSDPTLANPKTSETVQYLDGLGRPKQVVNIKSTPLGNDLVTTIPYDGFGRQVDSWLPTPMSTLNGGIQSAVDGTTQTFYNENRPFTHQNIENSPLDRVLSQVQTGTPWQTHPVNFGYSTNIDAEVKKYTATFEYATFTSNLFTAVPYGSNQLYKNIVTDEDGNQTIEFKNGQGQTILVRKMLNATESADTYYIYNNYDQLAYVIPPNAADAFKNLGSGVTISPTDPILTGLCYQYKYDGRNRLVEKKLPGKGWEYMLYDKQDRLVATQDTILKEKGQWLYTKYDQFGRVAITGIGTGLSRITEQNMVDGLGSNNVNRLSTPFFERQGMDVYYGNPDLTYPNSSNWVTLLSLNYYDTYPNYTFNPSFTPPTGATLLTDIPSTDAKSTKGLPVMILVKNIEDDNWTKNYTYYDTKGRVIGTNSINHLGGYTRTEYELDFTGVIKKNNTYHKRLDTEPEVVVKESFDYDDQNRLLKHWHQVNTQPVELLSDNTYNELSQISNKKVGNNLQSIDYTYNIRGWMTKINDPANLTNGKLFGYEIKYQNPINNSLSPGSYNGNIAEIDWKTAYASNDVLRRYNYSYDKLNRLINGKYSEPGTSIPENDYFTESLTYDLNGNIKTLKRFSKPQSGTTPDLIDDLIYNYQNNNTSNTLNNISLPTGVINNPIGYNALGNIISYDGNGNMTSIPDKYITTIKYNYLNLTDEVIVNNPQISNPQNTQYIYRSDGTKVRKLYSSGGRGGVKITDYLDGFQYEEGIFFPSTYLYFFPTSEGYYDYQENRYIYHYTDHLGNIRLSYYNNNSVPSIIEENNYYPFGLKHQGYNISQGNSSYNYRYNGKELQETGMYDYGARMYMPDLGRWGVGDLKGAEFPSWSSYNYSLNNPIRFVDPDGIAPNDIVFINNRGVEVHRIKSDTQFKTYIQASTNASNNPAQSTAGWKSVPMPNIIQNRPQSNEDVSGAAYQENDYQIAARTGYFNQSKNSGQLNLVTEGGNPIPNEATEDIPNLDPTLVKAVTVQESNAGTTGLTDIMQANVPGDWSKMKSSYQLSKGEKTSETNSLYAGTRVLATKGFKGGISVDPKTGKITYKFQGWAKAVEAYNGGGTAGYQKSVLQMQQKSKKPKLSDY